MVILLRRRRLMANFDSRQSTLEHITQVAFILNFVQDMLRLRAESHDKSKLKSPEKEFYDKAIPLLQKHAFGTEGHSRALDGMREGLEHHYKNNSHHPEHYEDGISGFDLIDLVEAFADWQAAGRRDGKTAEGLLEALQVMKSKYNISDQLHSILANTIKRYGHEWACKASELAISDDIC